MASDPNTLHSGLLLIAPPLLGDPNFDRTVVLLCEHSADGSFGLVLNRPLTLTLNEVMEGIDGYSDPLSLGGPVQPNTLHFLHRFGERVPGAIAIAENVFWGGDFDVVREVLLHTGPTANDIRFFLGYAGWTAGQLENEVEVGGWILSPSDSGAVFAHEPDKLWRSALRKMGGEYAVLANFPDDPRMN